jgi:carboxyl-terminal processing protease
LPEHPRIAYVRVNNFGKHTRDEMDAVMNQLDEHGYEALILDLRNNPGGYLDAAVSMSDLFLESGTICTIRGRDATTIRDRFEATGPGTYSGFPMVVLVNRFSASASEIVAAALQDHHRAIVIGERSYGKGSVQSVIRLGHGDRELKLTTAYYFRPSNKKIHRRPDPTQPGGRESENEEWGVIPDDGYRLELSDEQLHDWTSWRNKRDLPPRGSKLDNPAEHDKQLDKAVEYLESQLNKPESSAQRGLGGLSLAGVRFSALALTFENKIALDLFHENSPWKHPLVRFLLVGFGNLGRLFAVKNGRAVEPQLGPLVQTHLLPRPAHIAPDTHKHLANQVKVDAC